MRKSTKLLTAIATAAFAMALVPASVMAADSTPYSVNGVMYNTLQDAVDAASTGSTIVVSGNAITQETVTVNKNCTIRVLKDANLSGIIIDADNDTSDCTEYTINDGTSSNLNEIDFSGITVDKNTNYIVTGKSAHSLAVKGIGKTNSGVVTGTIYCTNNTSNPSKETFKDVAATATVTNNGYDCDGVITYSYTFTYEGYDSADITNSTGSYTATDSTKAGHTYKMDMSSVSFTSDYSTAYATVTCAKGDYADTNVECSVASEINADGTTTYTISPKNTTLYSKVSGTVTYLDLSKATVTTSKSVYDLAEDAEEDTTITVGDVKLSDAFVKSIYVDAVETTTTANTYYVEISPKYTGITVERNNGDDVKVIGTAKSATFKVNANDYEGIKVVQFDGNRVNNNITYIKDYMQYKPDKEIVYDGSNHSVVVVPNDTTTTVTYKVYKALSLDEAKVTSDAISADKLLVRSTSNLATSEYYPSNYYVATDLNANEINAIGEYIVVATIAKEDTQTGTYAFQFAIYPQKLENEPYFVQDMFEKTYGEADPKNMVAGTLTDADGNTLFEVASHSENAGYVTINLVATKAAEGYGYTEGESVDSCELVISRRTARVVVNKVTATVGQKVDFSKAYTLKGVLDEDIADFDVTIVCNGDYSKVGTYTLTAQPNENNYDCTIVNGTLTVTLKANKVTAKAVTKTFKANKKTKKLAKNKAFKLSATATAKKVTFKKTSGNSKIVVASNGKVTVKKGLKKGTYKVVVTVTSAASGYKTATAKQTVTVKVK